VRKISVRNSPADTRTREEGEGGGAAGTQGKTAQQPVVQTMVMQVVPLKPMADHRGRGCPHCSPWGTPLCSRWTCSERNCRKRYRVRNEGVKLSL